MNLKTMVADFIMPPAILSCGFKSELDIENSKTIVAFFSYCLPSCKPIRGENS